MSRAYDDRLNQRMRALGSSLAKIDRILANDLLINVNMTTTDKSGINSPGYTVYPYIFINYDMFQDPSSKKTLASILGMNYHELSHGLYTPRDFKYPSYFKSVPEFRLKWAMNALEDQRIESLFTIKYPNAGMYFTEAVIDFLVDKEDEWPTAFLLTYGRTYLPLKIREGLESKFMLDESAARTAKRLINQYKDFTKEDFKYNVNGVLTVVAAYWKLWEETIDAGAEPPKENCSDGERQMFGEPQDGEAQELRAQEKEQQETEEQTGEDQSGYGDDDEDSEEQQDSEYNSGDGDENDSDDGEDSDNEDSEEGDEDEDSSGGGEGSEGQEDASRGNGGDDGGEQDDDDEISGSENRESQEDDDDEYDDDVQDSDGDDGVEDGKPSKGVGGGGEDSTDMPDEEFEDLLGKVSDKIMKNESLNSEVNSFRDAMNDRTNIDVIDFDQRGSIADTPTQSMSASMVNTMEEFRRIYADVEPGWKYGSDSGKLNVDRAISDPENYDEHFDEWEEGREQEAGLEVFIAMDSSMSMIVDWSGSTEDLKLACQSTWIVKRALDDVDVPCTVVSFDYVTNGLYRRDEKATTTTWPYWHVTGGDTRPAQSFHLARGLLNASDAPNKLFVIITDGQWSDENEESFSEEDDDYATPLNEIIESIPGTRIYIGINSEPNSYEESFHVNAAIDDISKIPSIIAEAVTNIISQLDNGR